MARCAMALLLIWSLLFGQGLSMSAMQVVEVCCGESMSCDVGVEAEASGCCGTAAKTDGSDERRKADEGCPEDGCPGPGDRCPCRCCQRVPAPVLVLVIAWAGADEVPASDGDVIERVVPGSRSLRPQSPPPKVS